MSGNVWRPKNSDQICEVLRRENSTIVLRGSGNNAMNAPLSDDTMTIELFDMQRLQWGFEREAVRVEPGVTVYELCYQALARGLWPSVVPVMVQSTLGGSLSVNAYGGNPYKQGSLRDYIKSFELLLASGEKVEVSCLQPELFNAVIGGLGLLGVVTNITLELQPIASAMLFVHHFVASSLSDMLSIFDEQAISADYLVGWIDGHAEGDQLGRGVVISGEYADMHAAERAEASSHTSTVFERMSPMQGLLHPLMNNRRVKAVNSRFYDLSMYSREEPPQYVPLLDFHSRFYSQNHPLHIMRHMKGHFFQPFVPASEAQGVFSRLLECSQRAGFVPFRCLLRRHKKDMCCLSYQIDGFSLELTYAVRPGKSAQLLELMEELHEQVIQSGGRFYHARDAALNSASYERSIGGDNVRLFKAVKDEHDRDKRFQSTLYQRLFA